MPALWQTHPKKKLDVWAKKSFHELSWLAFQYHTYSTYCIRGGEKFRVQSLSQYLPQNETNALEKAFPDEIHFSQEHESAAMQVFKFSPTVITNLNPILHMWIRDSCFTCDGSLTLIKMALWAPRCRMA